MKSKLLLATAFGLLACNQSNTVQTTHTDSVTVRMSETTADSESKNSSGLSCTYANPVSSLGIGLVSATEELELYTDSLLTQKEGNWQLHDDEHTLNFCAKFHKPDYGILEFVCIKKTASAFQVLINYNDIRYVPNSKAYVFKTWEHYILTSLGISRDLDGRNEKDLPLRTTPGNDADTLKIPKGLEMFCPMELKGDWAKVRYDCFYNAENNPFEAQSCHEYIAQCTEPLIGWLRWRNSNTLLINIYLIP